MSDPLNELKKPTLKRYIRAANKNKDYQYGRREMESQRGDEKAVKKTEKKLFHRTRGINRAVERLEETAQLDELKKSTLKSYINKAAQNLFSKGLSVHKLLTSKGHEEKKWTSDAHKKATSRAVGISKAVGKLEESLTTQAAVRKHFWDNHPHLNKKKIKDYAGTGKMHPTDTRVAFVDHVESLHRDGHISDKLANSVTLGEDTMPTINPFIIATVNNHPHEAREILSQQMSEKISDALATAKIDYAQNLFGTPQIQEEVEPIDEMMTRKHFQQVADVIKANPNAKKRNELAAHHAEIFKKDNPRFDHKRFYAAAGATLKEEVEQLDELSKGTLKSYVKAAARDLGNTRERIGYRIAKNSFDGKKGSNADHWEKQDEKQSDKRAKGLTRAVNKLAK